MIIVLFIIHVLIALALIGVVLLQKSEGGALGIGGGGMSGFMTGRSTANLLTRTTAILAVLFFLTSIALVKLGTYGGGGAPHSIIDQGPPPGTPLGSPLGSPPGSLPARPALPAAPAPPAQPAPPAR